MTSKHRVLMNNYHETCLGVLNAGQQFNLIALVLSNKEDENMYSAMIQGLETVCNRLVYIWTQNVQYLIIVMPFRSHF
jgi:hypothetical protein